MGTDRTGTEPLGGLCRWCGADHGLLCPSVKAFEFQYTDAGEPQLVRVEFFSPIDYPAIAPVAAETSGSYPKLKGTNDA